MLDSAQDFASQSDPEQVWRKVAAFLRPEQAELIRAATYTFRSLVARSWRRERVLLAGDAAHQMPPFLGQGMCSGVRDAQNLAFKLDLILRGRASAELLDTYQLEREPHVRWVIEKSIELGAVQTVRDPAIAAERDQRLLAQRAANQRPAKIRLPGLDGGFLAREPTPGRGELSVHGFVDVASGRGRFDAVVGTGFIVLATTEACRHLERHGGADRLRAAGVILVGISEPGGVDAAPVLDIDGTYGRWFAEHGWVAVVVRPDFYVYGSAADLRSVDALTDELVCDLGVALQRSPT